MTLQVQMAIPSAPFSEELNADAGTLWSDSSTWAQNSEQFTDWGVAPVLVPSGANCPIMLPGSWNSPNKVVNWTGPAGTYHIYRSQLASGAGNGASNGRYNYVGTVTTTGANGTWTDTDATVQTWHIVLPADPDTGAIIGCHSEESSPTSVALTRLEASSVSLNIPILVLGSSLIFLIGIFYVLIRSKIQIRR